MRITALTLLACLMLAGPAPAQDIGLKRLDTGTESRGWEAVGRVDLNGKGFCTGALVAPNLVLTAAHCLWDSRAGRFVPPERMEFQAGLRNGRAVAYRKVRRAAAHPSYAFESGSESDSDGNVPYDMALLELDQPIRLPTIQPYRMAAAPSNGDEVGVVSYARDRAEAPSLQEVCHVLGGRPGVLMMSCDVDFGSSGAPVFSMIDGTPHVVSVVAAKAELDGQKVALGSDLSAQMATLRAALDDQGAVRPGRSGLPQINGERPGRNAGTGAKFLKP